MSGARVRRRVEEEARAEEAWALQDYEWDPIACVAHKKRILASGEAADVAPSPLAHSFPDGALSGHFFQPTPAENPKLSSLPVLESVDRNDAEHATVCEVVGCGASLEGLKRYYVRMRVCERHLHAQAIVVNGVVSRFCQQCAKFQFVGEFAGNKKSCIATLERHNARHRAKVLARMQELNDGESDSAQTGGRSSRAKAKTNSRRKGCKAAAAAVAAAASASTSVRAGSASASADRTERANSGTSGAATMDGFWMTSAVAATQAAGHGRGSAANLVDQRAQRSLSPGVPVLPSEVATPSKPASPHPPKGVWDGASGALEELLLRPLVTTGGSGVVSTSERIALPPPLVCGGGGPFITPQQQQLLLSLPKGAGVPSSWSQQQYDVQVALAAVQNQVIMEGVSLGVHTPAMTQAGHCMEVAPSGMYGTGYRANGAVPGAWNHPPCAVTARTDIHAPSGQPSFAAAAATAPAPGPAAAAAAAASGGSAPSPSSAPYTSGSDVSAGGKASQGTARQALHAVGGGGASSAGNGSHGFPAETTKSRGSRQSEAEPCGSTGRIAMNAASPAYSANEGVSATRVSASGDAFGTAAGSGGAGDVIAPPQPGDVAARISSIMQELCPLIEQFKQEVAHGPMNPHDNVLTAAAPSSGTGAGVAVAQGMGAAPVAGSYTPGPSESLAPVMDTVMAVMQQASQLAASLKPPSTVAKLPWTVTSGGPDTQRQLAASGSMVPEPPVLGGLQGFDQSQAHASSLAAPLPQLSQPPPQQQQRPHPPLMPMPQLLQPGWRPLASHPGVVVNEAAVQQAACNVPTASSGPLSATVSFPAPPAPGPGALWTAAPAPATSLASSSAATSQPPAGHIIFSNYAGAAAAADTAIERSAMGGASQLLQQPHLPLTGAGFGNDPVPQGAKDDDSSEDDEMFQQLLTLLQDEAGDACTMQQQQQEEQRGIASTVHQAVMAHQQTVQAMPYGHAPMSPFYWPSVAAAAPPHPQAPSHPYPPPPLPPQLEPHPPMPSAPSWLAAPAVPRYVEEPDDVDPRELTRVSLKAMNVLPHELPNNLRANLRRWLKEARAEALQATLRPGCLQLVVDVLRQPSPSQELSSALIPANDADQAAADVFRVLGQRLRDTYVQVDRRVLQMRVGERPVVLSWEEAAEEGGLDDSKYPELTGCNAAAVCAGSQATLQLTGRYLSQPRIKVFARLRGHDLPTTLLPPEAQPATTASGDGGGDVSSLRLIVSVPPRTVGLMAVEVGVGHLLGDWWHVLVLPHGCEGAAEEIRRLQAATEAAVQQREDQGRRSASAADGAAGDAAGVDAQAACRASRRLVRDMASVLEVFAAAAAADASAAAVAAMTRSSSSSGGGSATPDGAGGDAAPTGANSPPSGARCPLPNCGSSHVSRSDASLTAISAASWSSGGRTDTLMSTNAGSTVGSFMTTSSASAFMPAGMAPGQVHVPGLPVAQHTARHPAAAAAAGSPAAVTAATAAAAAAAAVLPIVLLPPPPSAVMRQALIRAARLLRYAVARGMPYLTSLLLTAVNRLARIQPEPQPQPQLPIHQPQAQTVQVGSAAAAAPAPQPTSSGPSRLEVLAAAGVDLQELLRLAVLSGSAATVDQLTGFAARVLGSPLRLDLPQGPGGLSALHLAALLSDGGALACHLLATQPWAAWQWLCLGWKPQLEAASKGRDSQQPQPREGPPQGASPSLAAASVNTNGVVEAKKELVRGDEDEEASDEEDGEVGWHWTPLPPRPLSLTPGQLSVMLGNHVTVRKAVSELMTTTNSGSTGVCVLRRGPAMTAALVTALEAWGRTGVTLLQTLCAQLAQQKLE